ncbi:uncharacterized protein EI90DRAFT_2287029 [Cantharellus anzutake]|uniref:uncharacterized protein n=1 Tax=Cantharellus anzutake TaxID=1750568 RepID=UPI001903A724|nr:uncharacterized protein EI90DRAFT_2287029 [Cantharellus anzutake]KAF8339809.1 hypothetical protein EI90DRAFT_2287029 [Cantharellus anzutake]
MASPKRPKSYHESSLDSGSPFRSSRARTRSGSPLLRMIRSSSSLSPKKMNLFSSSKKGWRSLSPSPKKASVSVSDSTRPATQTWKTAPAPSASTPRKSLSTQLSRIRRRSASLPYLRHTASPPSHGLSLARSPVVSVYNVHDDPFRFSPHPAQGIFVHTDSLNLQMASILSTESRDNGPIEADILARQKVKTMLLLSEEKKKRKFEARSLAHKSAPLMTLSNASNSNTSQSSPIRSNRSPKRSRLSVQQFDVFSADSGNPTPPKKRRDCYSPSPTSSPSRSAKSEARGTSSSRKGPPWIPEVPDVSIFDPQLEPPDVADENPSSPNPFRVIQSDFEVFETGLKEDGLSHADSPPSIFFQPPSPIKDPSKRRGLIVNTPLLILNIRRTPSYESLAEKEEAKEGEGVFEPLASDFDTASPDFGATEVGNKLAGHKTPEVSVPQVSEEDMYLPVSEMLDHYFEDSDISAGSWSITKSFSTPDEPMAAQPGHKTRISGVSLFTEAKLHLASQDLLTHPSIESSIGPRDAPNNVDPIDTFIGAQPPVSSLLHSQSHELDMSSQAGPSMTEPLKFEPVPEPSLDLTDIPSKPVLPSRIRSDRVKNPSTESGPSPTFSSSVLSQTPKDSLDTTHHEASASSSQIQRLQSPAPTGKRRRGLSDVASMAVSLKRLARNGKTKKAESSLGD